MKKINLYIKFVCVSLAVLMLGSCTDDLNRFPINDSTDEEVYSTFDGYKGSLAKVYAGYTLTGNQGGPAGSPDISGLDEGTYADFIRGFFNVQEVPTDEAKCIWLQDTGIPGSMPSISLLIILLFRDFITVVLFTSCLLTLF